MKIYAVGGSVRDQLLGLPVTDRDHVVVGATPAQMVEAGYRPVGADFPVFLHPQTHEEYALARTERKTAPGYKGFCFPYRRQRHARRRSAAARPHDQCHRHGRRWHADGPLRRCRRHQQSGAAPCQ